MARKENSPNNFQLVPVRGESFLQMWKGILDIPLLYIPAGMQDEYGFTSDPQDIVSELSDPRQLLDDLTWTLPDGNSFGAIYTDRGILRPEVVCIALAPDIALERYFHNKQLYGVRFNSVLNEGAVRLFSSSVSTLPDISVSVDFSGLVERFILPAVIGLFRSRKIECSTEEHVYEARQALIQDRVYEAYYHSAVAREAGAKLEDFYFTEALALQYLGLTDEALSYLAWYQQQGGEDPRHSLLEARLLSNSGRRDLALPRIKSVLEAAQPPDHTKAFAYLEKGRAHLLSNEMERALPAFESALSIEPHSIDARLGRALALRGIHLAAGDSDGLNECLDDLKFVYDQNGFHSAEALHHAATVHARLKNLGEAEKLMGESLRRRESSLTRNNLVLMLLQQDRFEEARTHYDLLQLHAPDVARGLTRFFEDEQAEIIHTDGPADSRASSRESTLHASEKSRYEREAKEATKRLQSWNIAVQGDILDFRRIDDHISHFAPSGQFIETSVFHNLPEHELQRVMLTIALHLSGVLVHHSHARWVPGPDKKLVGLQIQIEHSPVFRKPLSLFGCIYQRLLIGACADNFTNLDMLVSLLPQYNELVKAYVSPIPRKDPGDSELREYHRSAQSARETLSRCGYELTGYVGDLKTLDQAISDLFEPGGNLREDSKAAERIGDDTQSFILGLGFCLGLVIENATQGKWTSHRNISAVSLRDTLVQVLYPIQLMQRRVALGPNADAFNNLQSLEAPLVCAELARRLQRHEIETRDELAKVLSNRLPVVAGDDPTGDSIRRMVDTIFAQAGLNKLST